MFDLVVVGGGIGGLATAALAQRLGLRTALLEAHTTLGGCAGYFRRGPFTFDAGATALMGLRPGEPLGDLFATLGLDFQGVQTPAYRVHMPDRVFDIVPDLDGVRVSIPGGVRDEPAIGEGPATVLEASGLRWETPSSVRPRASPGCRPGAGETWSTTCARWVAVGSLAASTSAVTVQDVLRMLGLNRDVPFRSLVAMLLQDTAQAGPETVPFANAAACLQAYRLGMSRPRGGMQALAEGLGQRFAAHGGDLRTGDLRGCRGDRARAAGKARGRSRASWS